MFAVQSLLNAFAVPSRGNDDNRGVREAFLDDVGEAWWRDGVETALHEQDGDIARPARSTALPAPAPRATCCRPRVRPTQDLGAVLPWIAEHGLVFGRQVRVVVRGRERWPTCPSWSRRRTSAAVASGSTLAACRRRRSTSPHWEASGSACFHDRAVNTPERILLTRDDERRAVRPGHARREWRRIQPSRPPPRPSTRDPARFAWHVGSSAHASERRARESFALDERSDAQSRRRDRARRG